MGSMLFKQYLTGGKMAERFGYQRVCLRGMNVM
jgi:hypothetical protein